MAHEYFMVFARPIEGKDDELVAWWDRSHIPDVLSVDGFSSAKRLKAPRVPRSLLPHLRGGRRRRGSCASRASGSEGEVRATLAALDLDTVQFGFFTVAKEHAAKP